MQFLTISSQINSLGCMQEICNGVVNELTFCMIARERGCLELAAAAKAAFTYKQLARLTSICAAVCATEAVSLS